MKKIVLLVVIAVLLIALVLFIATFSTNKSKIARANIMYGVSETCNCGKFMTADIVTHKCNICLQDFQGSSSAKMCAECSDLTNRCVACGKIDSNINSIERNNYDS